MSHIKVEILMPHISKPVMTVDGYDAWVVIPDDGGIIRYSVQKLYEEYLKEKFKNQS